MARRSNSSTESTSRSRSAQRSPTREDQSERVAFDLTGEQEPPKGVWCIVASVVDHDTGNRPGDLDPGAKVYCFPPMRGGAFESVEVIGPHRKTGKLAASVIAAANLTGWQALNVTDSNALQHIAPPWDSSHVSQRVAEGIVAWKAGGPWPVNELRIWNRSRAEKVFGEGSLLTRLRGKIMSLFGKE